ncbi:MAG: trigger factor [Microgenomates group bacterium Gr01-1014_16]|nr:MAG: trigger factor [Microgenomates group bacterium Gr01-1014_16]
MIKSSPQLSSLNKLPNGTIELSLTVRWSDIQKGYEKEVTEAIANAELPGFRKGKAPRNLVEAKLDKSHLYSHAVQHLLPEAYAAAVKTHNLKPVLYPQIKILKGQENQDWEFQAITCEAPSVILPEKLSSDLNTLRQKSQVKIPDLLVEEEANHRLASLAENITKLGLTSKQYLASKKLTPESLKAQISQNSRTDLETEFTLLHLQSVQKLPDRKSTLDFLQKLV